MQLNTHQRVLGFAGLHEKLDAAICYDVVGVERRYRHELGEGELEQLLHKFARQPQRVLACMHKAIKSVMDDFRISNKDRASRASSYVQDYQHFMVMLDHAVFSHDGLVRSGIPLYIPDGFADLGAEPHMDNSLRQRREKIQIHKLPMFARAKSLFDTVYQKQLDKENIADAVAAFVHEDLPYDHDNQAQHLPRKTVRLDKLEEGVCRHQSLYAQVLLQAFGFMSSLMKCTYDGGAHVANLVRMRDVWHLLDVTNPFTFGGKTQFLIPVPQTDISLNDRVYVWNIRDDKAMRSYVTRNNMFYTIR